MTWKEWIGEEVKRDYLLRIFKTIQIERSKYKVFPEHNDTFRAFSLCPMNRTKVVIIAQDPYPQPDVADGLAFSTRLDNYIPETLNIVFKDLKQSMKTTNESCNLEWWAKQGVLLLNSSLTVRAFQSNSHRNLWTPFITKVLNKVLSLDRYIVWMLWGNEAKTLAPYLLGIKNKVLQSPHPVAESRGSAIFCGRGVFTSCNKYLREYYGIGNDIDWNTYNEDPFPVEWQRFDDIKPKL